MEFSPNNNIVRICVAGMEMEEKNKPEEALKLYSKAWNEASDDLEKFIAAYFLARQQKNVSDKIEWMEASLQFALKINNESVNAAFPSLYMNIARCYEESGDHEKANKNYELAASFNDKPSDKGPFYHGTKADLKAGDLLTPGGMSNYNPGLIMNHIYFTASVNGAGLAAALARGDGRERVYIVEPTGIFENDPNVTNKKFPGNPTRSYRTALPLRIAGEVTDWVRQTTEELQSWRSRLDASKGEIIN